MYFVRQQLHWLFALGFNIHSVGVVSCNGLLSNGRQAICWSNPESKVHGANMGPIWGRQDPGGPHVGPMNFVIWECWPSSLASIYLNDGQHRRLSGVWFIWVLSLISPFNYGGCQVLAYNSWPALQLIYSTKVHSWAARNMRNRHDTKWDWLKYASFWQHS